MRLTIQHMQKCPNNLRIMKKKDRHDMDKDSLSLI